MDRPNVVWVTLDSVRADHTSMAGYDRDTTPNLSRLASVDSGQYYSMCFSHAHSTRMNTASILTGTYPTHHMVGVHDVEATLPRSIQTLGEIFSDVEYTTAFFSRNANGALGYDAGFDRFEWISGGNFLDAVDFRTTLKYLANIRRHSAGLTRDTAKHATPFVLNDMAKRWLNDRPSKDPFFLYLHYNEPHRPYYPPLPYLDMYTQDLKMDGDEAAAFALDVHNNIYEYVRDGLNFSDAEWGALHAMYDAEIRYTDEMVGRLVEHVRSVSDRPTLIVVTADHGELFGEHGLLSHETVLDDALTQIPLVILEIGETDFSQGPADGLVQHVDVVKELVETAGGNTSQLQGEPLDGTREYVVSQRREMDFDQYAGQGGDFDVSRFHRPPLTAIRTSEFKLQKSDDGVDLFALPDETKDVKDEFPDVASDLESKVDAFLEGPGKPAGESRREEMTAAMKQQLEDLGYR